MDKILAKLADNTTLALVVVGLFLAVIGAAGGWPNPPLRINEISWRVVLTLMGGIVTGVGIWTYWRERNRSTAAWILQADVLGIRIVSPTVGEYVGSSFSVDGIYHRLPEDIEIWVFVVCEEGRSNQYHPLACATIDRRNQTWHGEVKLEGRRGGVTEIRIFAVGREGQVLLEYYEEVRRETGRGVGIPRLTSDMVECASVKVISEGVERSEGTKQAQLGSSEFVRGAEDVFPEQDVDYRAEFISQNVRRVEVSPGEVFTLEVVWKNIGRRTWTRMVRMGTVNPRDHISEFSVLGEGGWVGLNRVEFGATAVPPNEFAVFKIPLKAPSKPGVYRECFGLVFDGYRWFTECPTVCVEMVVRERG